MGLRGPQGQPTALKILRGNPGKRPLNKNEPQPAEFKSKPPAHLDDEARREWRRLVPILKRMRVLTEADYIGLANLCQSYSTMVKAQNQLAQAGLLYKTINGHIQPSPLISIVNKSMAMVVRLMGEFGLSPSARGRIQAAPAAPPKDDEWDVLGNGRNAQTA